MNVIQNFKLFVFIAFMVTILLTTSGCVRYDYKRVNVAGDECHLNIWSMREIQAGSIRLSKSCALTGGADGMTYNAEMMKVMGTLADAAKRAPGM